MAFPARSVAVEAISASPQRASAYSLLHIIVAAGRDEAFQTTARRITATALFTSVR